MVSGRAQEPPAKRLKLRSPKSAARQPHDADHGFKLRPLACFIEYNIHCASLASWWAKSVRASKSKTAGPRKTETMKPSEVQTKVLKGTRLFVGTFQGEEVREVRSKKDGHSMFFHSAFVLNNREVVAVGIPSPADAKKEADIKLLGHKEGAPVVVEFSELGKTPYGVRARGMVHLLEA